MIQSGNSLKGVKNSQAKLSDADVVEIKRELNAGSEQQRLAETFGVSQTIISNIKLGKYWRHVQ